MSWEKVRLGDVFLHIRNGASIKQSDGLSGIPITRIETISGANLDVSKLGYADINDDRFQDYYLEEDDILMSHINSWAHLGKNAIVNGVTEKIIHGMNLLLLKADKKVLIPKYAKHYFDAESFRNQLSKISNQSVNQSSFSLSKLKELFIPLPPLPIQKRIAEILDAADTLKRKDQELLKKYDELSQAIFIDMFGDPVKNEKGWEVKKLGEVCDKITDGTHFSPPNESAGIPYITAKHVRQDRIDFYANPTYISKKHHAEIYARCKPIKGDVLYIKDGATTGVAAVNEYDFEFSMLSSLALIKPNKIQLNSYYLSCYLNNSIVKKELIRSYMAGAAIKRFTLDKISKFEIVVPSIELQNNFELRWRKLQESVRLVMDSKSDSLFSSLLKKAFTGELVS